jgi:hypothetical protein
MPTAITCVDEAPETIIPGSVDFSVADPRDDSPEGITALRKTGVL